MDSLVKNLILTHNSFEMNKSLMESFSFWNYISLFLLRPLFALLFVLIILAVGWWVAWKTVLGHIPLVREICGLRKKPPKPQPPRRFYTEYYKSRNASSNKVSSPS